MITTNFYLCALPGTSWVQPENVSNPYASLHSFVLDALEIERRIQKGVNQENERVRYNLCCARIEAALPYKLLTPVDGSEQFQGALNEQKIPFITLGQNYLALLSRYLEKAPDLAAEARVGATFFPPATLATHNEAFGRLVERIDLDTHEDVQRRTRFLHLANQAGCGIIEIQTAFQYTEERAKISDDHEYMTATQVESPVGPGLWAVQEEEVTENRGRELKEILRAQLTSAVQSARQGRLGVINFSNQPHNIITEVLREFAYEDSGDPGAAVSVQVVYTDGSQSTPIPLRCLPARPESELGSLSGTEPLRVSLMSMRHLEMDEDIDMAWLRNSEVSRVRTLAESDKFCHEQTQNQLRDPITRDGLRIYLYQTGFQPAVVGFYRSLIEELLRRRGERSSLEVTPYYFSRKYGYKPGKPWY